MQSLQPTTPIENVATFVRALGAAVVAMMGGNRLANPVIGAIIDRIRICQHRFLRLIAHLAAGTWKPRRYHGRKPAAAAARPRQPSLLPRHFGWLLPLVQDAIGHGGQLQSLLQDPAMLALLAQAPVQMARVFRPLCWMLRLEPPPILAARRRAKAPPPRKTPRKSPPRAKPPKARPVRLAPQASPTPPAPPGPPAPPVARGPPLRA